MFITQRVVTSCSFPGVLCHSDAKNPHQRSPPGASACEQASSPEPINWTEPSTSRRFSISSERTSVDPSAPDSETALSARASSPVLCPLAPHADAPAAAASIRASTHGRRLKRGGRANANAFVIASDTFVPMSHSNNEASSTSPWRPWRPYSPVRVRFSAADPRTPGPTRDKIPGLDAVNTWDRRRACGSDSARGRPGTWRGRSPSIVRAVEATGRNAAAAD
jgi:hypothetical protein